MKPRHTPLDLIKAFGKQNYSIQDGEYKQQLANHPLVKNHWAVERFFVVVANTFNWQVELVSGESESVSGYTANEIQTKHAEWIMNWGVQEDVAFNMVVTKLAMEYVNSRPPEERDLIYVVYFYRAIRKDNRIITIQHQAIPLYFDANKIPFIFSNIFVDVSYLGITRVPHGLVINRFTDEIFHIQPHAHTLKKAEELFSTREREIIRFLLKGYTSRSIGEELYISPETVRTHRRNILKKAGFKSTAGLLGYAVSHGLI